MNPELERRLRQFGSTVDAAAAAEVERRSTAAPDPTVVADLDRVVALDGRRHHFYRALAVAAATMAVVAGGIIVAVGRSDPSTETAGRPDPPATHTEPAAAVAPTSTQPIDSEATTTSPATTTSAPESSLAPPRQGNQPTCPSYTVHNDYHLEICDTGAAVRLVQERLRTTVDPGLDVDGYFGPRTAHRRARLPASRTV